MERTSPLALRRALVDWTLVVALVTAAVTGWAGADRRPVPPELVGVWNGGSHSNGDWYYEFTVDGDYRAWPSNGPTPVNAGTVEVEGAGITFSNSGTPVASTWSVANGRLVLDGAVYTRA